MKLLRLSLVLGSVMMSGCSMMTVKTVHEVCVAHPERYQDYNECYQEETKNREEQMETRRERIRHPLFNTDSRSTTCTTYGNATTCK